MMKPIRNQRGQTNMEYVLIAIVIGLVVLFTAARFGGAIRERFTESEKTVDSTKIVDAEVAPAAEN